MIDFVLDHLHVDGPRKTHFHQIHDLDQHCELALIKQMVRYNNIGITLGATEEDIFWVKCLWTWMRVLLVAQPQGTPLSPDVSSHAVLF